MNEKIKEKVTLVNKDKQFVGFTEIVKKFTESSVIYMFPGYFASDKNEDVGIEKLKGSLKNALTYVVENDKSIQQLISQFVERLPYIYENIIGDIDAAYRGDPATINYDEIILTYPCFRAISAYRVAHELFEMGIQVLPRAISEYEHRLTGIDIHPGATIGRGFFIDHGTGVVIGETTIIGNNVTLYQNVTLGAKSFPHDDEGQLIKGIKRHPNIEDNVVIYAGATILGDITIGANSVIGGNTWITHSVPSNSKISQ